MSLRDSEAPFVPMASPKPPRPWAEMLDAWSALLVTLCAVLGPSSPLQERGGEPLSRLAAVPRWLRVWEMMWLLQPCSEARKAAFALGAAAWAIERWRQAQAHDYDPETGIPYFIALPFGERAESLLRIAARTIEDARGEAHAHTLGRDPTIPRHEAVYSAGSYDQTHEGINFSVGPYAKQGAYMILRHHFARQRGRKAEATEALLQREIRGSVLVREFADAAIASLPDGPWVMTTRDVERFLDLIQENNL